MDYVKVKVQLVRDSLSQRDYGAEIHPQARVSDLIAGLTKKVGLSDKKARFLLELDPDRTVMEQIPLDSTRKFVLLVDNT